MVPSYNWLLIAILVILSIPLSSSFTLKSEINLLKKKLDSKIELNPYFLETWERIEKFNGTKCSYQQGPHCPLFSSKQTSSQLPLDNTQDSQDLIRIKKYLLSKMRDLAAKADREYSKQQDILPSSYYIDKQRAVLDDQMFYYPAEKNIPIKLLIDFDALESIWPKESDAKGISSLQVMYAVDIDLNVQQVVQKDKPAPSSSLKLEFSGISSVQMRFDYANREKYFDRLSYLQSKPFNIAIETSKTTPGVIIFNMPVRIISFYAKVTAITYDASPKFNIRGKTSTSVEVFSQDFKQTGHLSSDQFQLFYVSSTSPVQILQFSQGLRIDNIVVEIDRKIVKKNYDLSSYDKRQISQEQAERPVEIIKLLNSGMNQIVSRAQQEKKDGMVKIRMTKEKRQQMREEYMIIEEAQKRETQRMKEEAKLRIKERQIENSFQQNSFATEKDIQDIITKYEQNPAKFLENLISTNAASLGEKEVAKMNEMIEKYKRASKSADGKESQPLRFRDKEEKEKDLAEQKKKTNEDDDDDEDEELEKMIKAEVDDVFANLHVNLNNVMEQLEQLQQGQANADNPARNDLQMGDKAILEIFKDFNKNVENIQNKYEDNKTGLGQKKEKSESDLKKEQKSQQGQNKEINKQQQQQQQQQQQSQQQQQQQQLKSVKELVTSMTTYFSFNEFATMKYPSKIYFAEDWLFLSRVIIFKLLDMQGLWGIGGLSDAEMKVIEIVLTGFQEIVEFPAWKEYKKLKETQVYGKDADANKSGIDYGVEERLNVLGPQRVLAKHSLFGKLDQHYAQFALRICLEYLSNLLYDSLEETDTQETLQLKLMTFLEDSIHDTLIQRMLKMLVPSSIRSVRTFVQTSKLRESNRQGIKDPFVLQDADIVTFYNLAIGKLSIRSMNEKNDGKGAIIFDQFLRVSLHLFKEFRKFKEYKQALAGVSTISEKDKKREFNAFVVEEIPRLLKKSKTLRDTLSDEEINSQKISVKAMGVFWTVLDPLIELSSQMEDDPADEDDQDKSSLVVAYEEQEKLIESVLEISTVITTENLYLISVNNVKDTSDIIRLSFEEAGEEVQRQTKNNAHQQQQSAKEDL